MPVRRRAHAVEGDLDVAVLRTAWAALLRRYPALRAVPDAAATPGARGSGGLRVVGTVQEEAALPADAFVDLGLVRPAPGDPPLTPERLAAAVAARPVPDGGPPAQLVVGRLGAVGHVVVLQVHAAVADEESVAVLVDELSRECATVLYDGPAPGFPAGPPPAPALRAVPAPVHAPVRAVPAPGPGRGARFDWGVGLGRELGALAAHLGVDVAAVAQAAVAVLLARRSGTGAATLAVADPPVHRPAPVGPFTGERVVTVAVPPGRAFADLVRDVVAARGAAGDGGPAGPGVPVTVAPAGPGLRLPGATVRPLAVDDGRAREPLAVRFDRLQPWPAGELRHRLDALDEDAARLLVEQLHHLLTAAVAAPATPERELPLEPAARTRARVRAADRTADGPVPAAGIGDLVRAAARRYPGAPAVRCTGPAAATALTYADLVHRAAAVTGALRALPRPVAGAPVAVRIPPGPAQVAALLGVLDAGAHLLCLGAEDRGERMLGTLAELGPAAVVVDGARADDPVLAATGRDAVVDVATLLPPRVPAGGPAVLSAAGPRDRAYLACTSGTTGRPKAIPMTHGALVQFSTWFAARFDLGPGARVAQWAAPGYDAALVEVFATLVAGAELCPVPDRTRPHPEKLLRWAADGGVTHLQTVPSFARPLVAAARRGPDGPQARLRHLMLAGEALSADLARSVHATWPGVRLTNLYGPTEAILATAHEIGPDADGASGPGAVAIGRSIPGRHAVVVDVDDRPCPPGVTGEIVLRSPHLTAGYLGAADAGAFRPLAGTADLGLPAGPCYRSGDLGCVRPDGVLEFRGRRDHQVKVSGMRVELAEVEAVLGAHPSVAACAVVAVPGPEGLTSQLLAFVVPVPDAGPDAGPPVWRRHVRRRFGSTVLPLVCRAITELPRTAGGKVDRRRLVGRAVMTASAAAAVADTAGAPAAPAAGQEQKGRP